MEERFGSLGNLIPTLVIFLIVLGGIYGGVFTPTEASGVGAIGVLLVALAMGRMTWDVLKDSLRETSIITSCIFAFWLP